MIVYLFKYMTGYCLSYKACVIITDISFIQLFQQPDKDQQFPHTVLYFTTTPTALPYHNIPDNNPTLIPSYSKIFPVSSSCHRIEKCLHASVSNAKREDNSAQLSVKYLQMQRLLGLGAYSTTVIFLISQLHRKTFEEN